MATRDAKVKRKARALAGLHETVLRLSEQHGIDVPELGRKSRDKDMKHIFFIEDVTAFLQQLQEATKPKRTTKAKASKGDE